MDVLQIFQGIGDSGQGAVNAVIFVMFTRSVRQRILTICCWFCRRKQRDVKRNEPADDEISDISDSQEFEGSSPMLINQRSPQITKQQNNMGSMATTTSGVNSNQSLSSYGTT